MSTDFLTKDPLSEIIASDNVGELEKVVPSIKSATTILDILISKDESKLTQISLLTYAAMKNAYKCIIHLINTGADPNKLDKNGFLPIHYAVEHEYLESISAIINSNKFNINSPEKDLNTILHLAVTKSPDVLNLILNTHGININSKNIYGTPPIMTAIYNNNLISVGMLIYHGADLELTDLNNNNVITLAVAKSNVDILEELLRKHTTDVNHINGKGYTPLVIAVKKGYKEIISKLLSHIHIDPNYPSTNGMRPLHFAAEKSQWKIMEMLIEHPKIYVNAVDSDGNTALHKAAEFNAINAINFLLSIEGVNYNAKNKNNLTPIEVAHINKHMEAVIAFGASGRVKVTDHIIQSNLIAHYIIRSDYNNLIRCIDKGYNIDFEMNDQQTPLYAAIIRNNDEIVRILLSSKTLDINRVFDYGQTILHVAIENLAVSDTIIIILLRHQDIDINAADHYERTPLHSAILSGRKLVSMELIQRPNLDINAEDEDGRTPVMVACQIGDLDVLKCLVERQDADLNSPNKNGKSPIEVALENGHHEIVKFLSVHARVFTNIQPEMARDCYAALHLQKFSSSEIFNLSEDV